MPHADQVRCVIANWFMCRSVHQLATELYGDQEGSHATPSEVALTQFVYPDQIKSASLEPRLHPRGIESMAPKIFDVFIKMAGWDQILISRPPKMVENFMKRLLKN